MKSNMKWKQRVGLVAIIMTLLFTAACGSSTNNGGSNSGGATTNPTTTPGTAPEDNKPEAPVTIKVMANYNTPEQTESDKKFIAEIEELSNVKLEFEVPPATGYAERLQLMLTSGDYPDVVMFNDTTDQSFQNAVKEGIIVPINEYLASAKHLLEYTYQASWDQLRVNQDENIYGIPRTSVVRNDAFFVRKDWLDNIQFEVPADNEISIDHVVEGGTLETSSTGLWGLLGHYSKRLKSAKGCRFPGCLDFRRDVGEDS